MSLTATMIAIALYSVAAFLQGKRLLHDHRPATKSLLILIGFGLVSHGLSIFSGLTSNAGFDLALTKVASLIAWLIILITLVSSLQKPIQNLFVLLLPLSALSLILTLLPQDAVYPNLSTEVLAHILLSILGYSVLTIAALQAVLLATQERLLHQRQASGLIKALPPLQTMEALLFELIMIGFLLLSASIVSGFIFLEDMFAQHVAHKTILSLIGWLIYAALLAGRYLLGWRGRTAIKWSLSGFCALMLAYFGSKLVIEVLL